MILKIFVGLATLFCMNIASANVDGSTSEKAIASTPTPPPGGQTYFDWGRGMDGYGYCYQFTWDGYVLNNGAAQPIGFCEQVRPSHFDWGRGNNGFGYCYQFTPQKLVMNRGAAQYNGNCERYYPSFYRWGRGNDGYTYCYQFTPYGYVLNDGRPVPPNYCY